MFHQATELRSSGRANLLLILSGIIFLAFSSSSFMAHGQTGEWVWMGGSSTVPLPATCQSNPTFVDGGGCGQPGMYGQLGIASAANIPGGRDAAVYWTAPDGKFWLFGGDGVDSAGNFGYLNDLWQFDPEKNEWTWMSGSSTLMCSPLPVSSQEFCYALSNFGTQGVAAATNVPGSRNFAIGWVDSAGILWLYGGEGVYDAAPGGVLGDLWKFDPGTAQWTWVNGSQTVNALPVFGTLGVASSTGTPGARYGAASWTDKSGKLWLFGGTTPNIPDSQPNDLWSFDPATGDWTWMGGNSPGPDCISTGICGDYGVYGAIGVASASNVPGGRMSPVTWVDDGGDLWMFGGQGFDGAGAFSLLNDLWEYSPARQEWTWVGGDSTVPLCSQPQGCGYPGIYGSMGTPAAGNFPGSREPAASAVDSKGDFWLFGGSGYASTSVCCVQLNDLWEYSPASKEWSWMGGSDVANPPVSYGVLGTPSVSNLPPGRESNVAWIDGKGNFWFFGGSGFDGQGTIGWLNDLWEFIQVPSSVVAPVFTPPAGTYTSTQSVTISDSTPNATIYYAINATPTTSSVQYSGPIAVSSSETIEAIAVAPGDSTSAVASAAYIINLPAATPTFNPPAGTYTSAQSVTIADSTPNATIYYAINATPTTSSVQYSGPITLSTSETVEAIAVAQDSSISALASAVYVINLPQPNFTLGASPQLLSVSRGSQGTVTLTVTPLNGFNGTVAFACSGLPPGANCAFSPSTVAPTSGPVTTQLTFETSTTSAAVKHPRVDTRRRALILAALLAVFGWRKRRSLRMFAVMGVVFATMGLAGCTATFLFKSPPVISTVTITATSGAIQQTTTVTLTLNQ